jgi:hypothetical protein
MKSTCQNFWRAAQFNAFALVIDDVRNRVAAYEDSIRHHHEMVEMATYKDSIANKLLQESNRIKRAMKSSK